MTDSGFPRSVRLRFERVRHNDDDDAMTTTEPDHRVQRALVAAIAIIATLAAIAMVAFWPRGDAPSLTGTSADLEYVTVTVTSVERVDCVDPLEDLPTTCQRAEVEVTSGSIEGTTGVVQRSLLDRAAAEFSPGDRLVVSYNPLAPAEYALTFYEFQRTAPLVILTVVFVLAVIAFGRWKGLRALAGLVVSLGVIVVFLLPALLRGSNAVGVALTAATVIAFAALYLAHGVTLTTTVALLGTLAALLFITFATSLVSVAATLTGLSESSLQTLAVTAEGVNPRDILLAGIVIGALGVLDDVTVTQVSAVAELRRANPTMPRREVYRAATRIGRDHVASTVNTLVLAYVGAALALMLFFYQEGRALSLVLTSEAVAIEIVRTLVGSIGIIMAVPLTTGLAALVADSVPLDPSYGHSHAHDHSHDLDPPVL